MVNRLRKFNLRWLLLGGMLTVPGLGAAQAPTYDATTLGCARFAESVRGEVQSTYGSVRRSETVGRDGILVVHAASDSAGLTVVAWYDTLSVFREGPEGRAAPDAEGILGGRYTGILDPQGDYLATAVPFVPAALRDVFDFSRVPLHFFPPLPPQPLGTGREWAEGAGLTIWRLADSAAFGGPVARYRWTRHESWEEGVAAGDSSVIVHRSEREEGNLRWRGGEGPLGWTSAFAASIEFASGAGRTEVTQQVQVTRIAENCPGRQGASTPRGSGRGFHPTPPTRPATPCHLYSCVRPPPCPTLVQPPSGGTADVG
jgi:hypothetical protein